MVMSHNFKGALSVIQRERSVKRQSIVSVVVSCFLQGACSESNVCRYMFDQSHLISQVILKSLYGNENAAACLLYIILIHFYALV